MGYTSGIEYRDGIAPDGTPYQAVQTGPIKINHMALVAKGRMNARIGDAADNWGASPLTDADLKGADMPELRKIMVDGLQVETTDAAAVAIEKLQGQIATKDAAMAAAATAAAEAMAAKEKEIGAKDAEIASLKAAAMTDAALDARVAARADLMAKSAMVSKDTATAGLSDAAIRKAVVVAKLGDAAIADKADAYVEGVFDHLVKLAGVDPVKNMKDAKPADDASNFYAQRDAEMSNAWKAKKEAV